MQLVERNELLLLIDRDRRQPRGLRRPKSHFLVLYNNQLCLSQSPCLSSFYWFYVTKIRLVVYYCTTRTIPDVRGRHAHFFGHQMKEIDDERQGHTTC